MKQKKIKVYIKEPGRALELCEIENTLAELQKTVGGYIETVTLASDLVIICNEEGLINDLPLNCELCGVFFFGTIIFASYDSEGDFVDCTIPKKEMQKLFRRFAPREEA